MKKKARQYTVTHVTENNVVWQWAEWYESVSAATTATEEYVLYTYGSPGKIEAVAERKDKHEHCRSIAVKHVGTFYIARLNINPGDEGDYDSTSTPYDGKGDRNNF